jgi:hypothetical protein
LQELARFERPLTLLRFWRRWSRGLKTDRERREADDHEGKRQPSEHNSASSKRDFVIGGRRVTWSGKKQQRHDYSVGIFAVPNHEAERNREEQERHAVRPATDQRVQNVPAVELSDRHQVKRRDEDSDPAGKQPRV